MATTQQDSPGSGMRVGPFVLDIAAMGTRRRASRGEPAPVEVPVPVPDPDETAEMRSLASLTYLEQRALLDAERRQDDLPPELPDGVEEEVMGVLDDLVEDATPVGPHVGQGRLPREIEPVEPNREPVRSVPADTRDWRRSPLTPRAETRAPREVGRFPTTSLGRERAGSPRRDAAPYRGTSATGSYRTSSVTDRSTAGRDSVGATPAGSVDGRSGSTRVAGRSGLTGTYAPAARAAVSARPSPTPRPTGTRGGVGPNQSGTVRAVGSRVGRPPSGRYPVARAATTSVRRVVPAREAISPVGGSASPSVRPARDWTPARNVRDAQARVVAARASGAAVAAPPRPRSSPLPAYTPREPQYQLRVRAAIMADRDACGAIETSYTTDSVWQLDQRQDNNEIRIGLRQISLPKPMSATEPMDVPFVSHADTLWLVAEELEVPPAGRETTSPTVGTVVGFLTATIEPRREMVYLRAVAVSREYRRQHLGSTLIEHMRRWAAREGVPEITADVSAKNAPALRLLQRSGFRFCGYSDRLYRNGEVALFLAMAVR